MNLPKHFPNTVYPNSKILNFCSCQCSCYSRYFLDSFNQVLFFNNLNFLCNFLFAVFLFFVFCFVFCLDYLEIGVHWDSTTTFPCYATGFYLLWDSVHKTSGKFVNKENASVVEVKFLRVTKWSKAVGTEMSTQLRIWGIL